MSWTNAYVGVPYKDHGRSRDEGWDCWGLLRAVYDEQLGIALPSYAAHYESELDDYGIGDAFHAEVETWTVADEPRAFDAVWCRMIGVECHVGVFVEPGVMLHTMLGQDACLVRTDSIAWERRILRCYRHVTSSA